MDQDLDNRDAIGLVAILCSLLVIAMFIAGAGGALWLSAKLIGWKSAFALPFLRGDRWTGEGDQPHRGDVCVLVFAIVAWIVLFVSGAVFK